MKKLNLGCGNSKIEGYINLDIDERNNPDILFNLNKYPYPFKDDEFEYILADSVIEHLDDFVKTMEELYRILKPGGELFIVVPFHKHHTAWGDPTHKRAFSEITFKYFADNLVPPCHNPIKKIFKKFFMAVWRSTRR